VLDFGLAQREPARETPTVTRVTDAGVAIGTPGYMAPEQLAGGAVAARADVFAFGVLAWELATGEHPFGADPASLLARMTEMMEGRSAGLSRPLPIAGLDRIARRCLRASPAERYASGDALLADLHTLFDDGPIADGRDDRLWWWQCHQASIAALDSAMPAAVWGVRGWIGKPYGPALFFITLALATVSVTLRLNLLFTSRVHADTLAEHRAHVFAAIVCADALLAAALLCAAGFMASEHEAVAALLMFVAVAGVASLALIEPATTRGAGLS
jgi:hypothetical protein